MLLFFRTALEFGCLIAALLLLSHLAAPLASPDLITGRGGRYLTLLLELQTGQSQSPKLLPVGLAMYSSQILAILGLTGWVSLVVGRLSLPVGVTALICAAVWLFGIALLPVPLLEGGHRTPATVAALCLLLCTPLAAHLTKARQPTQQAARVWLYPLWVLLTGLGLLWLIDYSSLAAMTYRNLATHQFYALLAASFVLSVGASIAPTCVTALARLLARIDGLPQSTPRTYQRWPVQLLNAARPRMALLLISVLWCAGVIVAVGLDPHQSALRAELVRWLACILGGWSAYRWMDNAATSSAWRGAVMAALLCAVALWPLALGHDNGQIMLMAFAVTTLLGGLVGACVARPAVAVVMGCSLTLVLLAGAGYALYELGPHVSPTVAKRIAALSESFSSSYEYLSELRWFLASAPPGGYGFGAPWCGTLGSLSNAASCPGIPKEAHSDYTMAALAGIFGGAVAWAIAAATATFLLGLLRGSRPNALCKSSPSGAQPQRLAQWMVTLFVGISLMQLFVTSFGALGLMPLTGVTFPLLSYGKASLIATAFFAALAINRPAIQNH